jgi:hypothetical protein
VRHRRCSLLSSMKRAIPVMALVLVVGACGSSGQSSPSVPASSTSTSLPGPSTTSTQVATTTTLASNPGVGVAVSGWVTEDRRGTVLCPYDFTDACPGIPVTGGDLPVEGPIRVAGAYDGVALSAETVESWTPYERGDLVNPCTGGSGPGSGSQSSELESKVLDALAGNEDRLAGRWYADGQLVVGLTGPDDELAQQVRAADERVCVEAGYPMSQDEREALSTEISRSLAFDEGAWLLDSWDSVVDGAIHIRVEAIDSPTMDAVSARFGASLDLTSYIEVLDAPLDDLPEQQPPVPADLVIPTAGSRRGFAMMALRIGAVLSLDPEAGCLYIDDGDVLRSVVVWPFGYSAVSGDPTIVYDPAGNEVARTGVPVDLGGGGADIETVDPSQRCDADTAFQMGGSTLYEMETLWPQYSESDD